MKDYCSILEACEWIAFKYTPGERGADYGYKEAYLYKDDECREKIDNALKILKLMLLKFEEPQKYIYGHYYKTPEILEPLEFKEDYILDLKNNGIIIEGVHEVNVILFEGDDEDEKHYAPAYTDIEIDFIELKKAKYKVKKKDIKLD